MAQGARSSTKRPANRLYHSAKVSEYQFKRVLWSFVADEAVAEAAKHIALSANSIAAIYQKLRVYFTALGVFEDIYKGGDPREGTVKGDDFEEFELRLLTFHLDRVSGKRRMKATSLDEIDYNWCESFWRFHYSILTDGRPSEAVRRMMFSHLLKHIRLCGPVGRTPQKLRESAILNHQHLNQRLLWLERNSPNYRDPTLREGLREIRAYPPIDPEDPDQPT